MTPKIHKTGQRQADGTLLGLTLEIQADRTQRDTTQDINFIK